MGREKWMRIRIEDLWIVWSVCRGSDCGVESCSTDLEGDCAGQVRQGFNHKMHSYE